MRMPKGTTERKKSEGPRCEGCPHLVQGNHPVPMTPMATLFWCGANSLGELDDNGETKCIGFTDVTPDWCPIRSELGEEVFKFVLANPAMMSGAFYDRF